MISYDFETWGLHQSAEIISLGVVEFDPYVQDDYPSLVARARQWFFDPADQTGRTREAAVVEWWAEQGGPVIDGEFVHPLFDDSLQDFLEDHKEDFWIAKGSKDPMWFESVFYGSVHYRQFLDMRTIEFITSSGKPEVPNGHRGNAHSAKHDAAVQAWQIQRMLK